MNLEMEAAGQGRPWGKLVKVDSGETEVLLVKRECTVGRRKGCDLSFPANKLVSGEHCKIVQDESSGMVWLEDMSTNGTVINMSKLVKKQVHMLQNGDIIYFVYRKNEPEQNVAYVYHSINPELGVCQDVCGAASGGVDAVGEGPPLSVEPVLLRSAPRELSPEEPQPSTSTSASHLHAEGRDAAATSPAQGPSKAPVTTQGKERRDGVEPERKKRKTDNDKDHDLDQPHTSNTSARGVLRGLLGKAPVEETKTDKMEESLTCIICQDLLHDCVSLQPCMHTFCAACYSGWMERSSLCPTCRCPVERIRKNHILNNLVEAYLLQHPEKCRSEEDLRGMDGRNKITQDMLQPKVDRSLSDEDGSSDYLFEFSDNDSDGSDIGQPFVMCRQCPGYRREVGQMLFATGSSYWVTPPPAAPLPAAVPLVATQVPAVPAGADHGEECRKSAVEQPSTSADLCPPTDVVQYRCPPHGSHVICTCCLQPMPDRRSALGGQQVAAQQCGACQRPFCHLYWGCQRLGCQGCLARFNELNLTDKCLDGVLNNNSYESEILQDYLTSRGKTWRDVLQQGLQTLQQGAYHLSDYRIAANTVLCYCCGLRAFKELAYQFRQSIPASELPVAVMSRPDCYWGRNCRTQVKAHHAVKFNHICEQTRFKS